jgi:hypothetical protein
LQCYDSQGCFRFRAQKIFLQLKWQNQAHPPEAEHEHRIVRLLHVINVLDPPPQEPSPSHLKKFQSPPSKAGRKIAALPIDSKTRALDLHGPDLALAGIGDAGQHPEAEAAADPQAEASEDQYLIH